MLKIWGKRRGLEEVKEENIDEGVVTAADEGC